MYFNTWNMYFEFAETFLFCLVPSDWSDFGELKRFGNLHLGDVSVSAFLKDKKGEWQRKVRKRKILLI